MTDLLASVANLEEARLAAETGVDLIDLKNPREGALGALPLDEITPIVQALPHQRISATIGDKILQPKPIVEAVKATGATGVDFIKIGFFPGGDIEGTLQALAPVTQDFALIAVLFADYLIALPLIDTLAKAGFKGVMLDTARKEQGPLTKLRPLPFLQRFIDRAREQTLLTGLAGSLRLADIPALLELAPDYLGFRGALCDQQQRSNPLDRQKLMQIREAIPLNTP